MIKKSVWLILFPLGLFLLYDFSQMDIMNSLAPYLHQVVVIHNTALGWISSIYFWINLGFLIVAGYLLDKYSPKWLIALSLSASLLGLFVFVLKPSAASLLLWRGTCGIAGAFSYLSVLKVLSVCFPKEKMGVVVGFSGLTAMIAGMFSQTPMILLITHTGVLPALWVDLLAGVIIVLICCLMLPHSPADHNPSAHHYWRIELTPYRSFKNWLLAIFSCLDNLPLFVFGALWGDLYLSHVHGFTTQTASMIVMLLFLGDLVGAPIMGMISDRVKSRKTVMFFGSFITLAIVVLISFSHTSNAIYMGMLFFLWGVFITVQTPAYAAVIESNPPYSVAKATGMVCFLSVFGGAAAQPLFGWLTQQATTVKQGYQNGMVILLVAYCLCIVLAAVYYQIGEKAASVKM